MTFNRRNFIGISLGAAAAPALAEGSLWKTLSGPNAVATIHAIVKEHLELGDEHLHLVARFTKSLQSSLSHTEEPEDFRALLAAGRSEKEALANYVIQEFVISTNYLAFKAREEAALSLLA